MADSNTLETMLQQGIRRGHLGIVMLNADFSLAVGTVTSVLHLRNARGFSTNEFSQRNSILYWVGNPTGTVDAVRYAADLVPSTGVLSNDTDWASSTKGSTNMYLLYDALHPQAIVDAMELTQRECYFPNLEPLSVKPQGTALADAGMQGGTGEWVESDSDSGPDTTAAAVTTANSSLVAMGIGSLSVTNAGGGAGGYIRKRYDVTPGEQYIWHVLSKHSAGSNTVLTAYDITNSASIDTLSHAATSWQWSQMQITIPSGCYTLELRMGNDSNSGVSYFNASAPLCPEQSFVRLDTKWDTEFKLVSPKLMYLPLGGQSISSGFYAAHRDLKPIPEGDYDFIFERPGANPNGVQFHNDSQQRWFQYPVYIEGRRAYSDIDTAPTLTLAQTTACDIDLFTWGWLKNLFMQNTYLPNWEQKLATAQAEFDKQRQIFSASNPADQPATVVVSMGLAP